MVTVQILGKSAIEKIVNEACRSRFGYVYDELNKLRAEMLEAKEKIKDLESERDARS
jgi:uncharacterized membrane protein